jgi:DNA adenine methylase
MSINKSKEQIKSPLRYPGGKSKALKDILPLVPDFVEYREPMAGGASVFFALRSKYPDRIYWINDKNTDLYLFWKFCKEKPDELITEINRFKDMFHWRGRGKRLYYFLKNRENVFNKLQRAARFFILNRISFSGIVDAGGYSQMSYDKRFTLSSIRQIKISSKYLQNVKITNCDYDKLLSAKGNQVFIFLDPPYMSKSEAKLYGYKGALHTNFNHQIFYTAVTKCAHNWLITYDKCSGIEKIYKFTNELGWNKKEWVLQYGTNTGAKKARIGKELFISNYVYKKKMLMDI